MNKIMIINLQVMVPTTENMVPFLEQYKIVPYPLLQGMPMNAVSAYGIKNNYEFALKQILDTMNVAEFNFRIDLAHFVAPGTPQGFCIFTGLVPLFDKVSCWWIGIHETYMDLTDLVSLGMQTRQHLEGDEMANYLQSDWLKNNPNIEL